MPRNTILDTASVADQCFRPHINSYLVDTEWTQKLSRRTMKMRSPCEE